MRRISVVLLLVPIFAATIASAAPIPERWLEVRSPHFAVLTTSSEKDARRLATQFERMRIVFHALFPLQSNDAQGESDPPIIVLAVKDRKAMQTLEPEAYLGEGKVNLAGLFLRAPDKNYILVRLDAESEGERPFATVYHEYTHYMLRKAGGWLPLWLNEGLAEFYENTDIGEKEVELGQPSAADLQYLAHSRLLPLPTLLAVDNTSPLYHDERKGSIFYAESWALTHFLIVGDRATGAHRLHDYTELLARGEDAVTAAQQAFGDLALLQEELTLYLLKQKFTYFKMKADLSASDAIFAMRPVPASEADAVRADVLICTDRTKEARALLDAVLHDDPGSILAHEVMGALSFREGNLEAAKKWYREAVQLNSQSYLAHYYYAALSLHTRSGSAPSEEDSAIESSLRTSIKLNPDFAPSYDVLAMFYALRHRNLDEAHALNLHAIALEPGSLSYRLDTAEVLAEQQQFNAAIGVLSAAARLARTPQEIEALRSNAERYAGYQAQLNRSASARNPAPADSIPDDTAKR